MLSETIVIAGSAASMGFVHTILGPDHYLPLVAMAKTNGWSAPKTAGYVAVCGISHLLGTLLLGALIFLLGFAFLNLETLQSLRGDFAGWFLLTFGTIYFAWGLNWAIRQGRRPRGSAVFDNEKNSTFARCTPFALFVFFILGPCEHLIPLMSFGAGDSAWLPTVLVLSAFCVTTILTMLVCVMFFYYGVSRFAIFLRFENYMHAATGLILFVCGCALQFHEH